MTDALFVALLLMQDIQYLVVPRLDKYRFYQFVLYYLLLCNIAHFG